MISSVFLLIVFVVFVSNSREAESLLILNSRKIRALSGERRATMLRTAEERVLSEQNRPSAGAHCVVTPTNDASTEAAMVGSAGLDWTKLGFNYRTTNSFVRCTYKNGEWGPLEVSTTAAFPAISC